MSRLASGNVGTMTAVCQDQEHVKRAASRRSGELCGCGCIHYNVGAAPADGQTKVASSMGAAQYPRGVDSQTVIIGS